MQKFDEVPGVAAERLRRLPTYLFGQINALKHSMRQAGRDIIDLGMGNPSDPPPAIVVEKLREAALDPRNHRYSASTGIPNLKREVAKHYEANWGVSLDPEREVVCTIGSKEGFSHLVLSLMGPGDTCLVPTPAFPIHIYAVVLAGANTIGVSMGEGSDEEAEARLLDGIQHLCENTSPRPKLLVLNYPHNPTTRVVRSGFYEEIVALAKRFGFFVISDFAYGLTVFGPYRAPSFLEAKGAADVGVECSTMSKAWSMAGWRVGFLVGNREMLECLGKIKGYYDYGIFQAVQIASIVALRHCQAEARAQAEVYRRRSELLVKGLQTDGWTVEPPKGTMFVWDGIPKPHRAAGSIPFAMKMLEEAEVALAPGRGFGEDGEGYVRLALVENEKRLQQALRQMRRVMRKEAT